MVAETFCRPLRGLGALFCAMSHGLTPVATFCRALRALNERAILGTRAAPPIPYVAAS